MKRENLKELGLDDEQVENVMTAYGKSVTDIKAKAEQVDTLASQVEDFKGQIAQRDEQLEKLQDVDVDSFKSEIDRLKAENQNISSESETRLNQELAKRDKDNAIDLKLRDVGVIYPDLVKNTLEVDDVIFKDGELIGIDEAIAKSKESYAGLYPATEKADDDYIPGSTKKMNERKEVDAKEKGRLKAMERHAPKQVETKEE